MHCCGKYACSNSQVNDSNEVFSAEDVELMIKVYSLKPDKAGGYDKITAG